MKKLPIVHVMDDPCNAVRYSLHKYPDVSQEAFGTLKGCFEVPSETEVPSEDVDCPDILPLEHSKCIANRGAMYDADPLVHPDSSSKTRYCLGTAIQTGKNKSHKSATCLFHDVKKSRQGKMLKTMTQESLQNCRKFRTIQVRSTPIRMTNSKLK